MQRLHKLSRRVDRHSKTCRDCNSICSQEIQGQTGSLHQTNAIAKPDPRLCPYGSRCDPQKALLGTFLALEKSTAVPLLTESRKEPVSLPRERKDYSSSKGKREDVPFVM